MGKNMKLNLCIAAYSQFFAYTSESNTTDVISSLDFSQSNFRRRMQNYATLCDKYYVIRGDISPHFRRVIAVNERFCGDKLFGI